MDNDQSLQSSDIVQSVALSPDEGATKLPVPVISDPLPSSGEMPAISTSAASGSEANTSDRVRAQHPNEFKKGSAEYRNAVEDFFKLSVAPTADPNVLQSQSHALHDSSSNYHTFREIDRIRKSKSAGIPYRFYKQRAESNKTLFEILDGHRGSNEEPMPISISNLRKTYNDVCKAVAEIELSASTLRTNSKAFTLSKRLVEEAAFGIFQALSGHTPSSYTVNIELSDEMKIRLDMWAETQEWGRRRQWGRRSRAKHLSQSWYRRESLCGNLKGREFIEELRYFRFETDVQTFKRELQGEGARSWSERWWFVKVAAKENRLQYAHWMLSHLKASSLFDVEGFYSGRCLQPTQIRDLRAWFEEDKRLHPTDWNESKWQSVIRLWTQIDILERRREHRIQQTEYFAELILDLMSELRKIDGSAFAYDLNISSPGVKDLQNLEDYIVELELQAGSLFWDPDRFMQLCNAIFGLIKERLCSKELKQGFDTLIKKQDHFRNTFMDFAAVAIFFSSITATTLQFSYTAADQSVTSTIVNLCWFASLVLSITSATNSFLGAIVHQSPEYLRPSTNVGFRILQAWFRYIPPALLSASGLLFLIGICAFTFISSGTSTTQGKAIQNITIALTSTNVLALAIMILLAFTKVIHRVVELFLKILYPLIRLPVQFTLYCGVLFLIALPVVFFDILYGLIRHHRCSGSEDDGNYFAMLSYVTEPLKPFVEWLYDGLDDSFSSALTAAGKAVSFIGGVWATCKNAARRLSLFCSSNARNSSIA